MEEVTKCSYINCRDLREKEQIFHELPVSDIDLCIKWLINSGHEYLIERDFSTLRPMKFFVCSNHFRSDSYLAKGTLKENAVPQPYWDYKKRINDLSYTEHNMTNKFDQVTTKTNKHRTHVYQFKEQNGNAVNNSHEERWCRTCATKKRNVVNITLKKGNSEMSLLSKLKLLIEVEDEDTLPLHMCYDCVKKLEQSFQFFQQIYIADNTLRHIFPKEQLDNDCYGITIDRVDGCVSDIEFDPILQSNEDDQLSIKSKLLDTKGNERSLSRKVSTKESFLEDTSTTVKCGTVFSLLTDTCHTDEELHWIDVLNAIERQKVACFRKKGFPRKTKISCEFCISKFTLRRQLKTHLLNNHPTEIRTMCMDCLIYFEDELFLLEHRAIVHHDDQLHRCDYCQKCFTRKRGLRLHITRSHARKRSYSCDLCQQKFISKQYLTMHIESGHPCANIKKEKQLNKKTQNVCMINFDVNTNQSNDLKTSSIKEQKILDISINKDFNHIELSSVSCPNNESQSMHLENTVHSVVEDLLES